ncbi:glycogen/starch/alpha-glucan phosphorylase [Shumkonia mesophila]|uniref:glycogen/starch/alpha-glucan phosphorylase n=1 Tax=Shumkonia mesophila TaxID=2838854 RepID=UPI002934E37A|nr:glycogen/starch/alpha-glucan phosphorylase [Shumkonia mesophila]
MNNDPLTLYPCDDARAGMLGDAQALERRLLDYMVHVVGKDPQFATERDWYYALSYLLRGVLGERLMATSQAQHRADARRVYYLSMEYLIGRRLEQCLLDLGVDGVIDEALKRLGVDIAQVTDCEVDAALGNGGLGRLAACFLDSLATHGYPGYGYGIRYEFGMFNQRIEKGQQVEQPENWLRYGNPWEFERPNVIYPVRFNGRILTFKGADGREQCHWVDTENVIAMAFDVPMSGFRSRTVTNLRLWSARSTREFDLGTFNEGNYVEAVREKTLSENLSKVLYPNDATAVGQELRLKQEYFFVSASIQDILRRFQKLHGSLDDLPKKVAIQLNDTHPALAIPELVRLLMDNHGYDWENAWALTQRVFSYTNHTLLPEALETWQVPLLEAVLPHHLDIIYRINDGFLKRVRAVFPGDFSVPKRVSLVDDDAHRIRMAHLAIVGSHKVNGVAALHTQILRTRTFADFDRMDPDKFVNVTNGITQRRWLLQANPSLAKLIDEKVGTGWTTDLAVLQGLAPSVDDAEFRARFIDIKRQNKVQLAALIQREVEIRVDPASMFDVQVKRLHEYKRQLLNILQVVARYNRIRDGNGAGLVPRTVIFGGKAAPSYVMAKSIIHLINDVAAVVNEDPAAQGLLKVVFIPNYNVSAAGVIIPGSDLSEQISTAGTEASGTGNMKFALNGALTIGTLDGANIEIKDEVGEDNIFIFGLNAEEAEHLHLRGYDPWRYYNGNAELKRVLDMVAEGFFSPDEPDRYRAVVDKLLRGGDPYLLLADFASYLESQERVDATFVDVEDWTRKAIINVAHMGKFSSDRSIHSYATDIWGVAPVVV